MLLLEAMYLLSDRVKGFRVGIYQWLSNRSADFGGECPGQLVDICILLIFETKTISKRFVPSDKILHRTVDNDAVGQSVKNDRRAWACALSGTGSFKWARSC